MSLTEDDLTDQQGWTERSRYQACFDKLYRTTYSSGRSEMDKADVTAFAHAFAERCVEKR